MPRVAPAISLTQPTKATLEHLVRSPSTPQNLAQRSRIILAAAAGKNNQQIASELELPEITVSKWRRCFASMGLDGLSDAPRSGRPLKHSQEIIQRVQNRVCQQPEHYSRWSVRTLAQDLKLPRSTVHQILMASNLQPHRIRTFTFSPDPDFAAKLLDIEPGQLMMAAAHNNDLANARKLGLMTAFFARPSEYGPHQKRDFAADQEWDLVATDIADMATKLGC